MRYAIMFTIAHYCTVLVNSVRLFFYLRICSFMSLMLRLGQYFEPLINRSAGLNGVIPQSRIIVSVATGNYLIIQGILKQYKTCTESI